MPNQANSSFAGDLGTIVGKNGYRHELTWDEMLWLARMLVGEPGRGGETEWAALLWTYASRAVFKRSRNFTNLVRLHSQPINPRWARDGEFCRVGGTHPRRRGKSPQNFNGMDPCSPERLDRRDRISNMSWEEIPQDRRDLLLRWARGQVPNPVPRSVDFAAFGAGAAARGENGFQLIWGQEGTNAFYSRPQSREWEPLYVWIDYRGQVTEEVAPEELQSRPEERLYSVAPPPDEDPEDDIFERNAAITVNRTSPPSSKYQYATLEGRIADPQTDIVLTEEAERQIIRSSSDRFYRQINAMKEATTLEMAQTVPVLMVTTYDDGLQNLSERVFNRPPFYYINDAGVEFPERPIAGIESLQLKIETPSVGGPTGITVATLGIKIFNQSLVRTDHVDGKYISYMFRQGFHLRIRYGVEPLPTQTTAFQWKEQDFFVAQHSFNSNDDKTANLTLTLIPATEKLFNQIHIGESIPFSDLGNEGEPLSEQDIEQILQSITGPDTTQEQLNEMMRRMRKFKNQFNMGNPSPGYRLIQNESQEGTITFGSVLHGAIAQSEILNNEEGVQPIIIENMVDALRTVQSVLLTRRIQTTLQRDAYRLTEKGVSRNVVNMGPLINNLVLPEMQSVANYVSQNGLKMGEEFSSDRPPSRSQRSSEPRRSNVKLIFGLFNSSAGQWADRPISAFPVNLEAIFSHLRAERDVGKFSSTINAFINVINDVANEPTNYIIERQSGQDDEPEYPLERAQIKYSFYPDPTDETSWIMYIFDAKGPLVRFRELLGTLNNETVPKEEIIEKLEELNIPWIEIGEENSIIKTLGATTQADDLIQAHNIILANQQAITPREMDGSLAVRQGISREFMGGAQVDPQSVIRSTSLLMPLEVSLTTNMIIPTAILFSPIYIFFPIRQFSAAYLPYVLDHEVRDGMTMSRFVLQINVTRSNRIPG